MSAAYDKVTRRILDLLDRGIAPWKRKYDDGEFGLPANGVSGREYRGINVITLAFQGYGSRYWVTFRQAKLLGGKIRKGERGTPVVFWKWIDGEDDDGNPTRYALCRYYTVFNLEQCDGVEIRFVDEERPDDWDPVLEADGIANGYVDNGGPVLVRGGRPRYLPKLDQVEMPASKRYASAEGWYEDLFHELAHSTGHEERLGRIGDADAFGSHGYGKEELIAEFASAILCAMCGLERATIENQAAYIAGWKEKIGADRKLVVMAGAAAQKAVDLMLGKGEDDVHE